MSNSSSKKNSSPPKAWRSIIIWGILAFFLRWQVIEPRWIPSGSMLPTLQLQDRILVEKITPKINYFIEQKININNMVVFRPPEKLISSGYDSKSALIKRVVGISGDQLKVSNGKLFRNNELVEESWIKEPIKYEMEQVIIPKDTVWVLGDNRNNSLDSHLWGPLPEKNIIGIAIFRYWPLNKFGPISIRSPYPSKIET